MNCELPEFDESILKPSDTEVVRPVKTMPLHEFKFRDFCQENGICYYLPLRKVWQVRNQTTKGRTYNYSREVLRPMFTGYVFVKTPLEQLKSLFETKLITKIIHVVDLDAFLEEVKTVRKFELVGLEQELEFNEDISVGDRFQIQSGVWEGVTGWLTCRDKKFKWTVQLEFINEMITTTIDPSKFKMLKL